MSVSASDVAWSALVWAVPFLVYLATCPRFPFSCGDALELGTASFVSGVAHAPGYPLFTLLGKVVILVTTGSIAFRQAILMAGLGSTATLVTFLFAQAIWRNRVLSVMGAATAAFSYHHWLYSMVFEVSMLSGVFALILPLLLLVASQQPSFLNRQGKFQWAKLWSVVFGLSLTHHYLILFCTPGLLLFLVKDLKLGFRSFSMVEWSVLALCFLAGLLPIAYLVYCARAHPFLNAGAVEQGSNLLRHLTRAEYGAFSLAIEAQTFDSPFVYSILQFYLRMAVRSFTWVGVGLGMLGMYSLLRRHPPVFRLLGWSWLLSGIGFFLLTRLPPGSHGSIVTLEKFLSVSFVLIPLFVVAGVHHLCTGSILRRWSWLGMLLPLTLLYSNWSTLDLRINRSTVDFGNDLLQSVEPDSLLLIFGDVPLYTAWYLQQVEGLRPDVRILSMEVSSWYAEQIRLRFPELDAPTARVGADFVRELIARNVDRRPVYVHGIPGGKLVHSGLKGNPYRLQPNGLVFRVVNRFDPAADDSALWHSYAVQALPVGPLMQHESIQEVYELYSMALHNRAVFFYFEGELERAIEYTRIALSFDPTFEPAHRALRAMTREIEALEPSS